jgi:hypothetical protein
MRSLTADPWDRVALLKYSTSKQTKVSCSTSTPTTGLCMQAQGSHGCTSEFTNLRRVNVQLEWLLFQKYGEQYKLQKLSNPSWKYVHLHRKVD